MIITDWNQWSGKTIDRTYTFDGGHRMIMFTDGDVAYIYADGEDGQGQHWVTLLTDEQVEWYRSVGIEI